PTAPIVADNALFFGRSPSIFHPRNHEFTLSHHFSVYPDQNIEYGGYLSKPHCGHLIRPAQVFCPRRLFCSFPLRLFLSRLLSAFRCQTAVFLLLSGDIVQPVLSISVSSLCIRTKHIPCSFLGSYTRKTVSRTYLPWNVVWAVI